MTDLILSRLRTMIFTLFSLGAISLLAACDQESKAPETAAPATAESSISITKSPNDNRQYRYLVLENKLQVLLVSDPDTDKAAASLTVLRGSYHEPEEYPGLAHFLEHMLFIGTRDYPEVDGYQQFIATHGGSSNAYTAAEHTNYFFDIDPEQFQPAMDRFAAFFISPLLDPAYVEREKNAVNSEYQMQIKDDGWRVFSATKAVMNPDYPGARFNIGNLETLGSGVDKALQEFFRTNYSADQMVLVALSNESLDSMESWVVPMFVEIENRNIGEAPEMVPAFADDEVPSVLNVQTLKDEYQISFNFPIPAPEDYYRKKPTQYLTNLLGHEGAGSLHQALKQKGWIQSLGAGTSRLDENNAYMSVDIELTPGGLAHVKEIEQMLFGYINLLASQEPEAWRYQEQAVAAELNFRFQEASSATGFVYRTGPAFGIYPPEDVLVAPYLMEEFDPELIRSYLAYLTPENLITTISGPDVETDSVERWFDVAYQLRPGPLTDGRPIATGLSLPPPNPFLPDNLSLLDPDDLGPQLAIDDPGLDLWLDLDTEFTVPRANQYFTLGLPGGLKTPEEMAMARLFVALLNDSLTEYTYPALLAGLGYQLNVVPAGFRLGVTGYSDKQLTLLDAVLERFSSLQIDPERFAINQRDLERGWRNFRNERPYQQAYAELGNLLVSNSFDALTLADAVTGITVKDLQAWRLQRLREFSVLGLSHGNLDEKQLQKVATHLQQYLALQDFAIARPQVYSVDDDYLLALDIDHDDAAIVLYVQDSEASLAQRARSALAAQMLRQQYFTALRTERQLGYVVSVTNRTMQDQGGLAFIIQSPVASTAELDAATREFMQSQLPVLEAMSESDYAQHKAGLISRLTERDQNLRDRTSRYLADLDAGETSFDSQQQIADIVTDLSKTQMQEFYRSVVEKLNEQRVLVYSQGKFPDVPTRGILLPDTTALKSATVEQADAE